MSAPGPRRPARLVSTAEGTHHGAFGPTEWGLLAATAAMFGSSFLFMSEGLESLNPGLITFLRLLLGTATLALLPSARTVRLEREDWGRVAALGVVWMAVPFVLFPVAQQWVDSAVAGMITGATPLFSAVVASVLLRRLPGRIQRWGLLIGFLGVFAVTWPTLRGADSGTVGVLLVVAAVGCYGFATNMAVPLQQRYGSIPVLLRAQLVALVAVTPLGLASIPGSHAGGLSLAAMVPLGVLGTGLALVTITTLVGRAGASRGSVAIYFVPPVALFLGVVALGEQVEALSFFGMALVVAGAWLTSRADTGIVAIPEGVSEI